MRDVSLHICDILENAAKAGATAVRLDLQYEGSILTMAIRDNGPGFPPGVVEDPSDPYRTTRPERPVGLGLALLRQNAEAAGGSFTARNREEGGAEVRASFDRSHVDAVPLGDVGATLETAMAAWPDLDITVTAGGEVILDTATAREELGDVPLTHGPVQAFLREALAEGLAALRAWADGPGAAGSADTTPTPSERNSGKPTARRTS
jgi:hypothetical protein